MKCICNYWSCQYDQGEQRQKLPAQRCWLSSTDWAREPRRDLAFSAHRSSVCSRLVVAADSSTDASQLRGYRISSPAASSPQGDGGEGWGISWPYVQAARGKEGFLSRLLSREHRLPGKVSLPLAVAQGNINSHFTYSASTHCGRALVSLGQSSLPGMAFHFSLPQDCQISAFKKSGLRT